MSWMNIHYSPCWSIITAMCKKENAPVWTWGTPCAASEDIAQAQAQRWGNKVKGDNECEALTLWLWDQTNRQDRTSATPRTTWQLGFYLPSWHYSTLICLHVSFLHWFLQTQTLTTFLNGCKRIKKNKKKNRKLTVNLKPQRCCFSVTKTKESYIRGSGFVWRVNKQTGIEAQSWWRMRTQ